MAQRQNRRQVDSERVQGEGSFVVVRGMTVGEHNQNLKLVRQAQRLGADADEGQVAKLEADMAKLMGACVLDWNWVDDDEQPLPLPRDDEGVLERLTLDEIAFLAEVIRGDVEKKA